MKLLLELYDIMEAISNDTAFNTIKATTNAQLQVIGELTQKIKKMIKDKDFETERFDTMLKSGKAKWFNSNYLSSRQFGVNGVQTAAERLSKQAKNDKVRTAFKKIANYRLSASADKGKTGELGKSTMFDDILDKLTSVRNSIENPELVTLLGKADEKLQILDQTISDYFAKKNIASTSSNKEQKRTKKANDPNKGVAGKQNQQAEEAFNKIVSSLPKNVQKHIRAETSRMGPAQKMAYLKKNM